MSILDSIQALTAEKTAWATAAYAALLREQNPTPEQAEAFKAAMELLAKTPADVQSDLAIIAEVQQIEARLPTPASVAAKKAACERADAIAMQFLPKLAASITRCAPCPLYAAHWLHRAIQDANWLPGPDRRIFADLVRQAAEGASDPSRDGDERRYEWQQLTERSRLIAAHRELFPAGQVNPRWANGQPAQGDAQAEPAPTDESDATPEEPTPAPADDELSLPFAESAVA